MRYCTDTWFVLNLFDIDPKSLAILEDTKRGKTQLIIPIITFAESTKKLLQKGIPQELIDLFLSGVEASEKIALVNLDKSIAREAARISLTFHVPLIDSCVAATAKIHACDILLAKDDDYDLLAKKKYLKIQSW